MVSYAAIDAPISKRRVENYMQLWPIDGYKIEKKNCIQSKTAINTTCFAQLGLHIQFRACLYQCNEEFQLTNNMKS